MATWQQFATTLITTASEAPSPFVLTAVLLDYMNEQERESLAMVLLRKLSPDALVRVSYYGSLLTPDMPEEKVDAPDEDDEDEDDAPEATAESNATAHLDVLKGGRSMTAMEIAEETGLKVETVRKRLSKSVERGQVRKLETTASSGPSHWTLTDE